MGLARSGGRAVAALVAAAAVAVPSAPAGAQQVVAELAGGDKVFWYGEYSETARGFVYLLEVLEPAGRLRVALDEPIERPCFCELTLIAPDGTRHIPERTGYASEEITVVPPALGRWRVEVVENTGRGIFRMRAKLEPQPPLHAKPRLLMPNLRVEPPFGVTFADPNFVGLPTSCTADETAEDGATRCLRFYVGPQNAGRGPLELHFSPVTDAASEPVVYQRLHYSDGTAVEREAGTYEYHKTHGHYHFAGFAALELLEVVDQETGELEPAGAGHKSGFCLGDIIMADWKRFYQAPAYSAHSNCGSLTDGWMGLSTGWTDIYDWSLPGNYVEFSDNSDGYYVVRAKVDAREQLRETNEGDNVGYAYVRVTGRSVEMIERGHGRSPWDREKVVVRDWWEALVPR